MNRSVRNSGSTVAAEGNLRTRLYRGGFSLLAALCLLLIPASAHAGCGSFGLAGVKASIKLPAGAHAEFDFPFERPTIVGLWHVAYTQLDGSPFNDTFDTWHSDGTEFESAFLPPAAGNVCVGVWKATGFRSVKLHHVGWLFNGATPTAPATYSFTLDEEVTVAEDNRSYSGKFTFKIWNLDGTPATAPIVGLPLPPEVKGTMAAARIRVD